jgi:hypothetical protein
MIHPWVNYIGIWHGHSRGFLRRLMKNIKCKTIHSQTCQQEYYKGNVEYGLKPRSKYVH